MLSKGEPHAAMSPGPSGSEAALTTESETCVRMGSALGGNSTLAAASPMLPPFAPISAELGSPGGGGTSACGDADVFAGGGDSGLPGEIIAPGGVSAVEEQWVDMTATAARNIARA